MGSVLYRERAMRNADTVSTETASQAPEDVLAWLVARLEEVSRRRHRLA